MSSETFGTYLKNLRESKGYTLNQLSTYSGVSNAQISRIENGMRGVPKPETIRKLADALKEPYEKLMAAAGYTDDSSEGNSAPSWATPKDKRDLKRMLEEDLPVMFDGVPIEGEKRQRAIDVLTGLFWEAKEMNKKTYGRKKKKADTLEADKE